MVILVILISLAIVAMARYYSSGRKIQRLEHLLQHTIQKLESLQLHFARFVPEQVIEQFTGQNGHYPAEVRQVTVLFADLKGFTSMCEKRHPEQVVSILNGYFRVVSDAIAANHGTVTELIGDGVLALFGALHHNPWQVRDAVNAALAVRKALKTYNLDLERRGLPALEIGMGIHQGEVLAGIMGNAELSKFGVVGDVINVASRIESLTRVHHCDLLISSEVKQQLGVDFAVKRMPESLVKGKDHALVTYGVCG